MAISRQQLAKELEPGLMHYSDLSTKTTKTNTQKSMTQKTVTELLKKK